MKTLLLTTLLLLPSALASAQGTPPPASPADAGAAATPPTADELLDAMDRTLQFETRTATATMTVEDGRRTRRYTMKTYSRGQDEAAVEYQAPARDRGTKMLKQGDNLWLYMPRAERVQKISGHMLRQGMMGSDMSYEDMMEAADFRKKYTATLLGAEETAGRLCWKVEARAKDRSVSYPRRVIWIDQETSVPLRQELYALSDMLLKTWLMEDLRQVEGRWVPLRMVVRDELRRGSRTTFVLDRVSFGVKLRREVFSRRWLERKR